MSTAGVRLDHHTQRGRSSDSTRAITRAMSCGSASPGSGTATEKPSPAIPTPTPGAIARASSAPRTTLWARSSLSSSCCSGSAVTESSCRGSITEVTSTPAAQHLRDLAQLRRVRDRIDREYVRPLDVEALARGAHMSAGHLSREFRLAYGESPYSYLMTRRIERAMALLRRGDISVTEACFAVGCSSLGTFSTRFAELVGVPPSVYRRTAAAQAADRPGAPSGMPSCVIKQVTRPVRNREARAPVPHLA